MGSTSFKKIENKKFDHSRSLNQIASKNTYVKTVDDNYSFKSIEECRFF